MGFILIEDSRYIYSQLGLPPGKRLQLANWKDPPCLLGKLTISTWPISMLQTVELPEGTLANWPFKMAIMAMKWLLISHK